MASERVAERIRPWDRFFPMEAQRYWIKRSYEVPSSADDGTRYEACRDLLHRVCGVHVPALTFWLGRDGVPGGDR